MSFLLSNETMAFTKKIAKNTGELKKIAVSLAKVVGRNKDKRTGAVVLALSGELGSGKTAFVRFFAQAFGIKEKVVSPTFVLIKYYKIKTISYKLFVHIDAYRIENPKEILDLGWGELIENPKNIILVEWAEKINSILPPNCVWIEFKHKKENSREVKIKTCYT